MATYTAIPNTDIETDKPIRAVTGRALRDNPIAIAEGASGAPRIDGATGPAVNTGGLFNSAVTTAKLQSSERMTTANVLSQAAGAGTGSIGSYALLGRGLGQLETYVSPGGTKPGSELSYASLEGGSAPIELTGTPSGTWRSMGWMKSSGEAPPNKVATLWLRIS